ncbi:hypothetical protein CRG98_030920 [Punica granatum]|uniref:Uncharacterized protein n=1 Tax=Punica granatum TaxID=22663 RepID=A0A2I0IY77_PUNGR|nr:hypothetical protein CRG98_030920 [Punica granatum]
MRMMQRLSPLKLKSHHSDVMEVLTIGAWTPSLFLLTESKREKTTHSSPRIQKMSHVGPPYPLLPDSTGPTHSLAMELLTSSSSSSSSSRLLPRRSLSRGDK